VELLLLPKDISYLPECKLRQWLGEREGEGKQSNCVFSYLFMREEREESISLACCNINVLCIYKRQVVVVLNVVI